MLAYSLPQALKRLRTMCVVSLCCFALIACSNVEDVYTGLTLKDANEMVALLRQNGIQAERMAEGTGATAAFKVTVPKEKFADSITILSQNGYPKETFKSLAEVFPGEGLVVSPLEQRARYGFAISQELSRTISGIDGVVKARVHVVMADPEARNNNPSKASASVSVHHRPSIDPSDLGPKIRLIVSNAVQGLSYNDVSISFFALNAVEPTLSTAAPNSSANQSSSQPQSAPPPATTGEAQQRRITSDTPSAPPTEAAPTPEPIVTTEFSWSWISALQYIAAFFAVLGGVLYIRRAMKNAQE